MLLAALLGSAWGALLYGCTAVQHTRLMMS
jgi:hypothetical protein